MVEQPMKRALRDWQINLAARLAFLGTLLFVEKLVLETLVDSRLAQTAQGLGAFVRLAQHWGFRYLVTFVAAVAVFAVVRRREGAEAPEAAQGFPKVRFRWILAHGLLVAALAPLSYFLYRADVPAPDFAAMAGAWVVVGSAAVVAAGIGLIPSAIWLQGIRSVGIGLIYAAIVALLGISAWLASETLWREATATTFQLVTIILAPMVSLTADPATRIIGTTRFAVEITDVCSGLEGLGLTLAFSAMWLICFRREYIFPRALILIPASLAAMFGLNACRIAALLLIGNAGFPEVAEYGFHSQAGWIAFNAVACALVFFSRRIAWLNRSASAAEIPDVHNPTATYLVPLLAILAGGTLSRALSGRFESLYPLRLVAAIAAIVACRHSLRTVGWQFSWRAPAVGAGVFLLWVGAAHWLLPASAEPAQLTAIMSLPRALWITSHCLTSVVFVPIAEELAYRGFLMRRLTRAEFECVPYQSIRWPALTITAITFGAAHGALWFPGIAAGMAYGLLVVRRGSLGEAVAAHATTNGLIAVAVIAGGQWQLW